MGFHTLLAYFSLAVITGWLKLVEGAVFRGALSGRGVDHTPSLTGQDCWSGYVMEVVRSLWAATSLDAKLSPWVEVVEFSWLWLLKTGWDGSQCSTRTRPCVPPLSTRTETSALHTRVILRRNLPLVGLVSCVVSSWRVRQVPSYTSLVLKAVGDGGGIHLQDAHAWKEERRHSVTFLWRERESRVRKVWGSNKSSVQLRHSILSSTFIIESVLPGL